MEKAYHHRNLRQRMRSLRTQCRNARMTVNHWHNYGNTEVRQIMSKHKNLQRLYQNLSLTQVLDSVNDRTFRLRKERDRLRERKDRLSHSCLEIKVRGRSFDFHIIHFRHLSFLSSGSGLNDLQTLFYSLSLVIFSVQISFVFLVISVCLDTCILVL